MAHFQRENLWPAAFVRGRGDRQRLLLSKLCRHRPGTNAGVWEAESVRVVLLVITSHASGSRVLEIHNLFAQLVMFTEQRLQRVCGR